MVEIKDSVAGFGGLKNPLRRPCILVKDVTFTGPIALFCRQMESELIGLFWYSAEDA